jgi:hypothetical protein
MRTRKKRGAQTNASETCIPGLYCFKCKEHVMHGIALHQLAFAMGLHERLGKESHMTALLPELIEKILIMAKPNQRQIPVWSACSFRPKC